MIFDLVDENELILQF